MKNKHLSHLLRKFVVMAIRRTFPKYKYYSGSHPRRLLTQLLIIVMFYSRTNQKALAINPHR